MCIEYINELVMPENIWCHCWGNTVTHQDILKYRFKKYKQMHLKAMIITDNYYSLFLFHSLPSIKTHTHRGRYRIGRV